MAEDKTEPKLSRRDFLSVSGAAVGALATSEFLVACQRTDAAPERPTAFYDNERRGWLDDAREYKVWRELVGSENPHAEEGYSLVFVGGVYLPPELIHFRTTPSFQRRYEVTGLITSSDPNRPDNNIVYRNRRVGGVLVINPVVVEGASSTPGMSENSFFIPSPDGTQTEDLKDIRHMWLSMATRPLVEAGAIGHDVLSRAQVNTGSAVIFANITLGANVSLIPPAGESTSRLGTCDGKDGFWRYAKLLGQYPREGEELDWIEVGETAVRWDGVAGLTNPISGLGVTRVGEIRIVKDSKEAREIMKNVQSPLRT